MAMVMQMLTRRLDELPAALQHLRTRPLLVVSLDVKPLVVIGDTPGAFRRIGIVTSGTFTGERLSGRVLDGSNDWQNVRSDGSTTLDVRLTLQTDDGAYLAMAYRGVRHGPAEVIDRLNRGEPVEPDEYYFRTLVTFEASAGPYSWLNGIISVGVGHRFSDGPVYSVFEVL
jgi:hypothetical protein